MPQHPAFQNIKSVFCGCVFLCAGCVKKHMACRKKYKPYILKYKALILKYVPYIFCEKQHLIFNELQRYKKSHCFDARRHIVKSFFGLILQRL